MEFEDLEKDILKFSNKEKSKVLMSFFKTGVGEYAENDKFLGISVPCIRKLSKKYKDFSLNEIEILLKSEFHEKRTLSLILLINLFDKKDTNKKDIVDFYLNNTKYINNWDLVDLSCYKILGKYIIENNSMNYDILIKLSKSKNLWEKRISIVSTMIFIKNNIFDPTFVISKILLKDKHNLINKAIGWLLREIGKKNKELLKNFLIENIKDISNITLNYSMEKFLKEEKDEIKKLKKYKNFLK